MSDRRPVQSRLSRARAWAGRFGRNADAVSMLEFALVLPVLLTLGMYGTEIAYMSTVDMQISQIANSVGDNASRLGQTDNSAVTPTITQAQVKAVLDGAIEEGSRLGLEENGRVILSSLERAPVTGKNYIHWQRCIGDLDRDSAYGGEGLGLVGATLQGLGKPGHLIAPPANSAVMFVEVYFEYQGLFGTMFVGNKVFKHEAAYVLRDDRNLTPGLTGLSVGIEC
ncbi:TadE/TadG family type IV pilus assembly protein [Novosphingobium aquimarinum]|uniref:TadE/TadG family type IV pilus assembly protein n=1 Tax=Novosphingobium aquimarinum TaxID=2682494 RepID=UPI0012EB880C|nr:pilus assembly protein TadE [Novosphingobium aquimarinum]